MNRDPYLDIEIYRESIEIQRIGSRAVRKAQEENRKLGIPSVYSHNGIIYYELPNGELTRDDPFKDTHKGQGL